MCSSSCAFPDALLALELSARSESEVPPELEDEYPLRFFFLRLRLRLRCLRFLFLEGR